MGDEAAWVTSSCTDLGLVVLSRGTRIHERPWSQVVVHDVRADNGIERLWFKANGIGTRHEPKPLCALSSLVADLWPEVLAVDTQRAWSLTRDAAPTWCSVLAAGDQWSLWEHLFQRYAVAQLALAAHRTRLLAIGVPERSPSTLPDQAAELIVELALLGPECKGLPVARQEALAARLPAYGQWCRDLDSAGIPDTWQHDDLHSSNICVAQSAPDNTSEQAAARHRTTTAARSRIIDWADASTGHPFGTMLATLRSIARHGRCEVDDPGCGVCEMPSWSRSRHTHPVLS